MSLPAIKSLPVLLIWIMMAAAVFSGCALFDEQDEAESYISEEEPEADRERAQPPQWYVDRERPPSESLMRIGYGSAESWELAEAKALEDISRQLGVRVEVAEEDISYMEIQDKQQHVEEQYRREARMEAAHYIKDWEVIKEEDIDGKYFIALRLDQRPSPIVIAEKIAERLDSIPERIVWEGAEWLTEGEFIEGIERQLSGSNDGSVAVYLELKRLDEQWRMAVEPEGKDIFHIPLDESDIANLLSWPGGSDAEMVELRLKPDEDRGYNRLQVGDWFVFEVASEQGGYLSLFNIYEDGRISVLEDNARVDSHIAIPSEEEQEQGHAFRAYPIQAGEITQDYYMAVLSEQRLSTADFQKILDESPPVAGEDAYQLHQLMQWLETQGEHVVDIDVIEVLTQP
ncbi:hypothetical protein [Halorhodospira halochloris]|uniref:hypothetical protein n=1 Tax=Halorhodospira halochloris TaxID=1052 RepID=UPI001EE95D0D|nr:hypothetical protein [Halorhodospira halochloris]MCG5547533.1 hypothetical protein [Halorhodospira halochloris]